MAGPDTDPVELLERHVPVLRYDSQEPYFCDSPAEWTDNPGNELRRADGSVIATASPTGDEPQLSLGFLGPRTYATGETVAADDRICDPGHDYVTQGQEMHDRPGNANQVYGHWATGTDGRVWLAYWFWYFYNDYNLIGPLIHAGLHEGDWEMIQLRLDPTAAVPDLAVYAQHRHAGLRPWRAVERIGDQPVVYPARGSHASYFNAALHWTGDWFDHADGRRPGPALNLHVLSDDDPADAWATWPGTWGGTQPPPDNLNPLNDSSPRGPGGHAQYRTPDTLLDTAKNHAAVVAASARPASPPQPSVTATVDGPDLQLDYDAGVDSPAGLVVTTGAPGDPTAVHRVAIDGRTGTVTIPGAAPAPGHAVHVSVAGGDGGASEAVEASGLDSSES